jgi:hypothetical protein
MPASAPTARPSVCYVSVIMQKARMAKSRHVIRLWCRLVVAELLWVFCPVSIFWLITIKT